MRRREFFRKGATSAIGVSLLPIIGKAVPPKFVEGDRLSDNWQIMGSEKSIQPVRTKTLVFDVAVIGAGMAGISAAVSAARNGAKTVLIQDRSVLGGNASSEIRVTVNGVTHLEGGRAERETGIIEEVQIDNRFFNPQESYSLWDHVLYDYVTREPNLELMMNTQAIDAVMSGTSIATAICWQSTTEIEYSIHAKMFVDCSGDGLLAAKAGALYRTGREGKSEFNEKYAPDKPDGWQMGASLLIQGKNMGKPMPYTPPSFALKYDGDHANDRKIMQFVDGYWWVELGSEFDIIADQEINRHKLMGYLHGVWDYIKNSGRYPESANYYLDWVGSLPGRRESRRFIGDYILSEGDLLEHRHFDDAVAYGGWSLDEHCPGGIENLKDRPSFFHYRFDRVYEIPFRCLYSKNISNLLFAGRNISQTHIALSSTRVQGTCALEGQAVGTGAALCVQKGIFPRILVQQNMNELQEQLLRDDAFIPNRPANDPADLARKAKLIFASSTISGDAKLLTDGVSRDIAGQIHHWQSEDLPAEVQIEWEQPITLSCFEMKCDTNLQVNITMRKNNQESEDYRRIVPPELIKSLDLEAQVDGVWKNLCSLNDNRRRLIKFKFETIKTTAVRVKLKETYGEKNARLFEIRCYS